MASRLAAKQAGSAAAALPWLGKAKQRLMDELKTTGGTVAPALLDHQAQVRLTFLIPIIYQMHTVTVCHQVYTVIYAHTDMHICKNNRRW